MISWWLVEVAVDLAVGWELALRGTPIALGKPGATGSQRSQAELGNHLRGLQGARISPCESNEVYESGPTKNDAFFEQNDKTKFFFIGINLKLILSEHILGKKCEEQVYGYTMCE